MGTLKRDIDAVVDEYVRKGWTVEQRKRYRYMKCPCGRHGPKTVHKTPSNPNYAKELRGWFQRQHCRRGMTRRYVVHMVLLAHGGDGWDALQANVLEVCDQIDSLEDTNPELLDWTLGVTQLGQAAVENSTARLARVEIAVTVTAASQGRAVDVVTSLIRTAIHAAGGATPDWDDNDTATATVCYRIHEENERPPTGVRRLQDA